MDKYKKQENDKEIQNDKNTIPTPVWWPTRVISIPTQMPPMMKKLYPEDTKKKSLMTEKLIKK